MNRTQVKVNDITNKDICAVSKIPRELEEIDISGEPVPKTVTSNYANKISYSSPPLPLTIPTKSSNESNLKCEESKVEVNKNWNISELKINSSHKSLVGNKLMENKDEPDQEQHQQGGLKAVPVDIENGPIKSKRESKVKFHDMRSLAYIEAFSSEDSDDDEKLVNELFDIENGLIKSKRQSRVSFISVLSDDIVPDEDYSVATGKQSLNSFRMNAKEKSCIDRAVDGVFQPGRNRKSVFKKVTKDEDDSDRDKTDKAKHNWLCCDTISSWLCFNTIQTKIKKVLHEASQVMIFLSWVLQSGLSRLVWALTLSIVTTASVMYLVPNEQRDDWHSTLKDSWGAVTILGSFLSFALVFRTQTCYNRWWEGRILWGKLIYAAVHTAQQGSIFIKDDAMRDKFMAYCIVFPYACKAMLRGNSLGDSVEEGKRLVQGMLITQEELEDIESSNWQPHYCIDVLRAILYESILPNPTTNILHHAKNHNHFSDKENNNSNNFHKNFSSVDIVGGGINNAILHSIEDSMRDLSISIGGAMRLNATGLPLMYNIYMKLFIFLFVLCADLSWAPKLGWFTPVITVLLVLAMNMIISIGDAMLKCFSLKLVGLPLQKFCVLVEGEVVDINSKSEKILKRLRARV